MTTPLSVPLDLVTTAILTLLRTTGRTVYDGAYAGDPLRPSYPYAIAYRLAGGNSDATPDLADSRNSVTAVWQVTAVSNLRNQCEATARLLHDRLVGRTRDPGLDQPWAYAYDLPMPPGWACVGRRPDPAMPGIDRAGDHPNAIYSLPARFYLTIGRI